MQGLWLCQETDCCVQKASRVFSEILIAVLVLFFEFPLTHILLAMIGKGCCLVWLSTAFLCTSVQEEVFSL